MARPTCGRRGETPPENDVEDTKERKNLTPRGHPHRMPQQGRASMNDVSQLPAPPKPKLLDRVRHEIRTRPGHILKSPRSARPLKKAQMQGGARCAARGVLRV